MQCNVRVPVITVIKGYSLNTLYLVHDITTNETFILKIYSLILSSIVKLNMNLI